MNDADLILGKKKQVSMPTPQPTYFSRYPARIRSIADAFIEEMGWTTDPTTKRSVAAGAKRFVDVHGEDTALMIRAIKKLRNEAPHIYDNISSPGSLITTARSLKRKPEGDSVEARQRYETDFWEVEDE